MAGDSVREVLEVVQAHRRKEAIQWCDAMISAHTQKIGREIRDDSDFHPYHTAVVLARRLPDCGLAELVTRVPLDMPLDDRDIIVVLAKLRRIIQDFDTKQQAQQAAPANAKGLQYAAPTSTEDLMTIDEIARLVQRRPKTLANSKVLGEPAVHGGGRSKQNRWHYLLLKAALESKFGGPLPDLSEARKILSQKP